MNREHKESRPYRWHVFRLYITPADLESPRRLALYFGCHFRLVTSDYLRNALRVQLPTFSPPSYGARIKVSPGVACPITTSTPRDTRVCLIGCFKCFALSSSDRFPGKLSMSCHQGAIIKTKAQKKLGCNDGDKNLEPYGTVGYAKISLDVPLTITI